jgi:hypothetical protein
MNVSQTDTCAYRDELRKHFPTICEVFTLWTILVTVQRKGIERVPKGVRIYEVAGAANKNKRFLCSPEKGLETNPNFIEVVLKGR